MKNYLPIVGMEIHVELKTKSKMFCGCKNDPFHAPQPNIYTCPVCLGLPGALPVPNRKAVEWAIMLGLALNCEIQTLSKFDRKNYFYPDLPKGYQISQYDQPIARDGHLVISSAVRNPGNEVAVKDLRFARSLANARDDKKTEIASSSSTPRNDSKKIRIHRVHLEEDTGKLLHETVNGEKVTLVDFNRSGVPLVEIVTEPDIHSAEEARMFLKKLHQIIRYLGISDADMEKGSMRLEPNVSVAQLSLRAHAKQSNDEGNEIASSFSTPRNDNKIGLPPYKVEVKNINSFKFVAKAIDYEVERQIELLNRGEIPVQETRGWEEKKSVTLPQRRKEAAHDYRYFPEPDIPPMRFESSQLSAISSQIPELPDVKLVRFIKDFRLPAQDAERLTEEREMAEYLERTISYQLSAVREKEITPKTIANWILNKNVDIGKVTPEELLKTISQAKTVVAIDEKELAAIITGVVKANEKAVADYKSGKQGALMFLLGAVMRILRGRGDAQKVKSLLEKTLSFS